MARFPRREADVKALAQNLATGLAENPGTFPAPPVAPAQIETLLAAFTAREQEAVAAHARAEQATNAKQAALVALIAAIRTSLRYAENTVQKNDAKLSLLGWGGRAPLTALQPPGQPKTLEIPRQGEDFVFLDWKKPSEGGAVASYKIERRERPAGNWELIDLSMKTETTLTDQERGIDWEYRVIAANKAGEGMPSNTVAAVV